MSLILFEGAAGTGKTTGLFNAARRYLHDNPLAEGQKVLALTKLHGSRQRLTARLAGSGGLGVPVLCVTLDSFALTLVQRWRGLVRHLKLDPQPADFQAIAMAAAKLLSNGVGQWVARTFPLILIDEMQDCKGADIALLAGLEPHARLIAGADAFQDLNGNAENEALNWASEMAEVWLLTEVHRTNRPGLLDAAKALRAGDTVCLDKRLGFEVVAVPRAPLGGHKVSWQLKSWGSNGEVAVISPVRKANSSFVDDLTRWVATKAAKGRGTATAGPYQVRWEENDIEATERLLEKMGFNEMDGDLFSCCELQMLGKAAAIPELTDWAHRQRFAKGRDVLTLEEIKAEILQIARRRRTFATQHHNGRHALTVHQAKNREFDSVIVLWPIRMMKDAEKQRRWLYNAITRAKQNVLVIVEDPKGDRLRAPPFVKDSTKP